MVVSPASSPHEITLHGATQVRALATALCTLPPMASGQSCPAAPGGSVRLVFTAGEQGFPPVSVQESGCRSVTGAGPVRSWSASSPFGQQLSEAVGGVGRLVPGTHRAASRSGRDRGRPCSQAAGLAAWEHAVYGMSEMGPYRTRQGLAMSPLLKLL